MTEKEFINSVKSEIIEETKEWGVVEHPPRFEGRSIVVILAPH